ncbi:MAG: hypothetical protein ACLGH7_03945, partial [Actinomycetes bacterium]
FTGALVALAAKTDGGIGSQVLKDRFHLWVLQERLLKMQGNVSKVLVCRNGSIKHASYLPDVS